MGNLLGAPVTEKETHVGVTTGGSEYGVSSMQGWRIHMEDAHITETVLYAVEVFPEKNSYKVIDIPGHSIFAVFDGHGGTFAAEYSGKNFCRVLSRQKKFVEYAKFLSKREVKEASMTSATELADYVQAGLEFLRQALTEAFVELDKEIYCAIKGQRVPDADIEYQKLRAYPPASNLQISANEAMGLGEEGDSGTTACVVLLAPDWVICANAGDSRAVISRLGNKAVPLSYDHKPDSADEERRIRNAGGYVAGGRVEGDLAVSRGLGDFRFKNVAVVMAAPFSGLSHCVDNGGGDYSQLTMQPGEQKVSPVPDIIIQNRNASQDEFIIVACDGIWDVQSNYEAVKTVGEMFQEGETNLGLICEEFCDVGLGMGSKDNMTALVVKLAAQQIGQGGGVLARRQSRDSDNSGILTKEQISL